MSHPFLQALHTPQTDAVLAQAEKGGVVALTGLNETLAVLLAASVAEETGKRVLFLSPSDLQAVHAGGDAAQVLGISACTLVGGEIDLTRGTSGQESAWRRLESLSRAIRGEVKLLCASAEAIQQRMGNPSMFRNAMISLKLGDRIPPEDLLDKLVRVGYERVDLVEGKGQCARRGDIVDIYPSTSSRRRRTRATPCPPTSRQAWSAT